MGTMPLKSHFFFVAWCPYASKQKVPPKKKLWASVSEVNICSHFKT